MPTPASPSSVAKSTLFKLPPELRERIYELALRVEPGYYTVTKEEGIPEPGLLRTCKIIRHEALYAFYVKNDADLIVQNWNPATMCIFMHIIRALLADPAQLSLFADTKYRQNLVGNRDWGNLLLWLQHYHHGDCRAYVYCPTDDQRRNAERQLILGLFETTDAMRQVPWKTARAALEHFRSGLTFLNPAWGVDREPTA